MPSENRNNWLIAIALTGGLFYLLAPVLTPFVAAALLAYLGDPLADRLQPLANVLWGAPTRNRRARCKEALAMMGVLSPRVVNVRPPQMPLDQEEKQRVKNALKKAHLL